MPENETPEIKDTYEVLTQLAKSDPEAYAQHCMRVATVEDEWAFLVVPPT